MHLSRFVAQRTTLAVEAIRVLQVERDAMLPLRFGLC